MSLKLHSSEVLEFLEDYLQEMEFLDHSHVFMWYCSFLENLVSKILGSIYVTSTNSYFSWKRLTPPGKKIMERKCDKAYSNLLGKYFRETNFETMHLVCSALIFGVDNRILYFRTQLKLEKTFWKGEACI